MDRISVSGKHFLDEAGRTRIFSGVNAVYKGDERDENGEIRYRFGPDGAALSALAAAGTDLIRLGVTWAGIEPERGRWNDLYLADVKNAVRLCEARGIRVLLDFHQDLFSAYCYCGDGAPEWACVKPKAGRKPKVIWAEGYFFSGSVRKSFDRFWLNTPVGGEGLQERYCEMLRHTLAFLADCPGVMGVDVLNEPFPGSAGRTIGLALIKGALRELPRAKRAEYKSLFASLIAGDVMGALRVLSDPKRLNRVERAAGRLVRRFDLECYGPFLERAAAAVRSVSPGLVIFAENCYFSNLGIPCSVERPAAAGAQFAVAPHGYDVTVDTPLTNRADPARVDYIFNEHRRLQERLGCPVVVGEWGGMVPGDERYPALEHLIDRFDSNGWSQTYWHWFPEMPESPILKVLARPRPAAVAGTPLHSGYDRRLKRFTMVYAGDAKANAPTRVYVPEPPKETDASLPVTMISENGAYYLELPPADGPQRVALRF